MKGPLIFVLLLCCPGCSYAQVAIAVVASGVQQRTPHESFAALQLPWLNELASGQPRLVNAPEYKREEEPCPNQGMMDRLCSYIRNREKDNVANSAFSYRYQRIVYEASCVDFINDSEEEIIRKVNQMWILYGDKLQCGPMGNPATGSPLKYAMYTLFNDFITEAVSIWKLDLNRVENGETLLDYVERMISETTNAVKKDYERYRDSFIRAGAKRQKDLK